jgi:NAD(P)-dependent dehydrogenase (short-subunit alcohol dehydrogenase family)
MKNEWAIVTGGSGLVGRECIETFLDMGRRVLNIDLKDPNIQHPLLEHSVCDITESRDLKRLLGGFLNKNQVTDLVNCAFLDDKATNNQVTSTEESLNLYPLNFSSDEIKASFNVGILGTLNITFEVANHMIKNKSAHKSIIFIGSDLSVISPDQRVYIDEHNNQRFIKSINYTVLKHATIGATKHLSTLLAPYGVRVNCISPGAIDSDQPEFLKRNLRERIPLGRLLSKEEIRGCVRFLSSEDSAFITGQNIVVDGGRSVW